MAGGANWAGGCLQDNRIGIICIGNWIGKRERDVGGLGGRRGAAAGDGEIFPRFLWQGIP